MPTLLLRCRGGFLRNGRRRSTDAKIRRVDRIEYVRQFYLNDNSSGWGNVVNDFHRYSVKVVVILYLGV